MNTETGKLRNLLSQAGRSHSWMRTFRTQPLATLRAIRAHFAAHRARRAAIDELARLDERALRDLGIRRDQIADVVDGLRQGRKRGR